ncbi:hypothetical protein OIU84_028168 [Salix udensis]|uniref:Uncharacterized protein n=1 Tax=Salix udensis TaxID=889485 RepID=A0AAD6KCB6_9ROSI|nr:hypothetical protein OIU84_028168 [Salix udensis]
MEQFSCHLQSFYTWQSTFPCSKNQAALKTQKKTLTYTQLMASGSLLLSLSRSKLGSLCALEKWKPVRFLSSGGASRSASEFLEEEELNSKENEDDLKGRIFRLRLPKRSATNVIDKWVREGNAVSASELRHISKELRKSQRFKHALEV